VLLEIDYKIKTKSTRNLS